MADLSLVTDNYLPTASETFSDNLSGSISAGATTVPVNSAAEYADGETVVLTVEPGTSNEATFVGKKDTGVNQFIECIWTEGNTAVGHDAGATIIDYDSATHYNLLSKALQLIMNQDGTLKDDPIRTALGLSDASNDGWEVFPYTFSVSSGYNKGQNEYELTVANQDVRTLLSLGMRLRLERNTAAPTQCMDLESGSSQYAGRASGSLTGVTFTDDYTIEGWVKLESYTGSSQTILQRQNGSTAGFSMYIDSNGSLQMNGLRIAANNRTIASYIAIPTSKWTHVAGAMDHSANSHALYINGVSVNFSTTTNGTITAIVQPSVDLRLGATNTPDNYFDGKLSDIRLWSAVRTATEIRDNMNQQLTGAESNLVSYWKLNGDLNDSHANANHLTGSGGAVATSTDNPFSSTQYAIVTKVAYSAPNSTVTVYTGTDHVIPNTTLISPYYSVQRVPYGFPASEDKWEIQCIGATIQSTSSTSFASLFYKIQIPLGAWSYGYQGSVSITLGGATTRIAYFTLSLDGIIETDYELSSTASSSLASSGEARTWVVVNKNSSLAATTTFTLLARVGNAAHAANVSPSSEKFLLRAVCAYL